MTHTEIYISICESISNISNTKLNTDFLQYLYIFIGLFKKN